MPAARAQGRGAAARAAAPRGRRLPALGAALGRPVLARGPPPPGAVVAGFWPMGTEIDIRPLLLALHERGHPIALPVTPKRGQPLRFRRWRPGDALAAARWAPASRGRRRGADARLAAGPAAGLRPRRAPARLWRRLLRPHPGRAARRRRHRLRLCRPGGGEVPAGPDDARLARWRRRPASSSARSNRPGLIRLRRRAAFRGRREPGRRRRRGRSCGSVRPRSAAAARGGARCCRTAATGTCASRNCARRIIVGPVRRRRAGARTARFRPCPVPLRSADLLAELLRPFARRRSRRRWWSSRRRASSGCRRTQAGVWSAAPRPSPASSAAADAPLEAEHRPQSTARPAGRCGRRSGDRTTPSAPAGARRSTAIVAAGGPCSAAMAEAAARKSSWLYRGRPMFLE